MSNNKILSSKVVQENLRKDIPDFKVGSSVTVFYKIIEGNKQRIQPFSGIVTNRKAGNSLDATFTVTKNSINNIKVERTFPLNSPNIEKITVENLVRTKRSNLNNQAMKVKDIKKTLRTKPVKIIV